jgi:ADP-ribose pyrophosphatase YjhB (NUDIX family)
VRIILIRSNEVLLVKHSYLPYWYLPGGAVNKGENLEGAIRREIEEELEGDLKNLSLLGVYTNFFEYKNDHIVCFVSDNFTIGNFDKKEIKTVKYFPLDQLPGDIAPGSRNRIEEYKAEKISIYGNW